MTKNIIQQYQSFSLYSNQESDNKSLPALVSMELIIILPYTI